METLCRKCGNELSSIEICMDCYWPTKWQCLNCKNIKESIHVHEKLPFVMAN
jgi:hypothetical protein